MKFDGMPRTGRTIEPEGRMSTDKPLCKFKGLFGVYEEDRPSVINRSAK